MAGCRWAQVKGHLERDGKRLPDGPVFGGKWSEAVHATAADETQHLLWQAKPMPPNRCKSCLHRILAIFHLLSILLSAAHHAGQASGHAHWGG
jgi:hypothetical protein